MTLPSLFLAHGAPDLPISDTPARRFLSNVGGRFDGLRAVVVISAHWEARVNTIGAAPASETIYDFGGFDPALFSLTYPARTSAEVVAELDAALEAAGIAHAQDSARGYDHGAWIPMLLALPKAEIPVVQLSLRRGASPEDNFRLGEALAPLLERGILVVGSGAIVHNLRFLAREATSPPDWAIAFDNWIVDGVISGNLPALLSFPHNPPSARIAHPTPEHLMPLYVALGAGGGRGKVIHRSFSWGSIAMTSFEFDGHARNIVHNIDRSIEAGQTMP